MERSKVSYRPRTRWRVLAWQVFTLLGCFGVTVYFGYHTVAGRFGLEARTDMLTRSTALAFEAETLQKAKARLERDIALLSPEIPDPDIVTEIARDVLGYADPRDRIIRLR